jgi:hypothetical protein
MNEFVLNSGSGGRQHFRFETFGNGYGYEAVEVERCLREGRLESETVPLEESLAVLRTMDRIRDYRNLRFPGEYKGRDE